MTRRGAKRIVFPAHAGMNRGLTHTYWKAARVPRPRGDEPLALGLAAAQDECSPPTRG